MGIGAEAIEDRFCAPDPVGAGVGSAELSSAAAGTVSSGPAAMFAPDTCAHAVHLHAGPHKSSGLSGRAMDSDTAAFASAKGFRTIRPAVAAAAARASIAMVTNAETQVAHTKFSPRPMYRLPAGGVHVLCMDAVHGSAWLSKPEVHLTCGSNLEIG